MSTVLEFSWRCDRCGRSQPSSYDPKAATQEGPVQWTRVQQDRGTGGEVITAADLCRDCSEAFTAWLWVKGATA